jgi:hypothetical protein
MLAGGSVGRPMPRRVAVARLTIVGALAGAIITICGPAALLLLPPPPPATADGAIKPILCF